MRQALRELRYNRTQHAASIIVALLVALLGTMLIEAEVMLQAQSAGGGFYVHPYVPLLLGVLGIVFVVVATFVALIVTANTFATVMAGRAKRTALYRLLGASARALRRDVTMEGFLVGVIGSLLGVGIGIAAAVIIARGLMASGVFIDIPMNYFAWPLVFPIVIGVAGTTLAAWIGTVSITDVSPVQALGRAQEPSLDTVREQARKRRTLSIVLIVVGTAMLAGGVAIGAFTPDGLLLAVPGGAISFIGFISATSSILPPVLAVVGRMLGGSAAAKLAAANATRYPARTARSTIGLIIGITLVTMFGVGGQTYTDVANRVVGGLPADAQDGIRPFLGLVLGVIGLLIGFSLLIAAVGLVNALSLSVTYRRREIGLLRALGFTRRQVRLMLLAESLQLTLTATVCGVVLGTIYGWAGALAAISSDHHIGGYFWFSFPWYLLVGILVAAGILAAFATLIPARRANSIAPAMAAALD